MKLMLMMPLLVGSQWRNPHSSGLEEMPSQFERSCVKYIAFDNRLFVQAEGYEELAQKTCGGPMIPCAYREDTGGSGGGNGTRNDTLSDSVFCFPQEGSEKCCAIDADITAGPPPKPKCGGLAAFNYSNPEDWGTQFTGPGMECSMSNGSPINIVRSDAKEEVPGPDFEPLRMEGHKNGFRGILCDNGYNLRLESIVGPEGEIITYHHPNGAQQIYGLSHIEWHIGSKGSKGSELGSEHSMDDIFTDMEMQMVFYDRRNKDYGTALNKFKQVTVLSIMYEVGEPNANLDELVTNLKSYKAGTEKNEFMGNLFTQENLISRGPNLEKGNATYYYYLGSMNHPPRCKQGIWWTVSLNVETISKEQLEVFQTVKGHGGNALTGNNRPVQKNENMVNLHGPWLLGTTTTTTSGTTTTSETTPTGTGDGVTPTQTPTGTDDGVTPTQTPTGTGAEETITSNPPTVAEGEVDYGYDW